MSELPGSVATLEPVEGSQPPEIVDAARDELEIPADETNEG